MSWAFKQQKNKYLKNNIYDFNIILIAPKSAFLNLVMTVGR